MMRFVDRCLERLESSSRSADGRFWIPLVAALLAVALCLPALGLGWVTDDHFLRFLLAEHPQDPQWNRSPLALFSFLDGDAEQNRRWMASGVLPWWSDPEIKIAFFRPLAGISHWLDHWLWPERAWAAHAHSLAWLAAAVALAAVLYRRILAGGAVAGLAALLFALDDAHALPGMWIANRHSVLSVTFGLLALLAHDAWRRGGRSGGAVVAPVALAAALLAGEGGLSFAAYFAAYALFLERTRARERALSLMPALAVVLGWAALYRGLGFGAAGSAVYVDPTGDPAGFVAAVAERLPLLAMGLWTLPSDLSSILSAEAGRWLWRFGLAIAAVMLALVVPLLRRSTSARFFACGAIGSLLLAGATFPSDRLLLFAGLGGMGLLAEVLVGIWRGAEWLPAAAWWRRPARGVATILAVINILFAPLGFLRAWVSLEDFGAMVERSAASFPHDAEAADQWVLIADAPAALIASYGPPVQFLRGRTVPSRGLVLGSGITEKTFERIDEWTLVVRAAGGFLARVDSPGRKPGAQPPGIDVGGLYSIFDRLYRDRPMPTGTAIELDGASIEVLAVTPDGRPETVAFRFVRPLEDPTYRWIAWGEAVYEPFRPPPVGARLTRAAPDPAAGGRKTN